jgi:hypothetical protein
MNPIVIFLLGMISGALFLLGACALLLYLFRDELK